MSDIASNADSTRTSEKEDQRHAILLESPGVVRIVELAVQRDKPDHVLIKPTVVAVNPIDYMSVDYWGWSGTIPGCELVGTVVEVGANVKADFKPGDRVMSFVHGCKSDTMDVFTDLFSGTTANKPLGHELGAFSEYVLGIPGIMAKVPDNITDEEAVTLPVGLTVAGMALYQLLGLPFPEAPLTKRTPIMIYGASTGSGLTAVQLAKLSGLRPLVACSPKHFDYMRSLGADECFDYNSPTFVQEVRRSCPILANVYDCWGADNSTSACCDIICLSGGTLVSNQPKAGLPRPDVKLHSVASYACFEQRFSLGPHDFPPMPGAYDWASNWWIKASKLIADGQLKPLKAQVRDGGLEEVIKGIDDKRDCKVRGEKLVVRM